MKIGIVVPVFPEAITSNALGLADGLSRRGHDVLIITSARVGSRSLPAEVGTAHFEPEPCPNHAFRVVRLKTIPTLYGESAIPLKLLKVISQGFDVLLVQEDYPPFCLLAALLARRKRIPYILSFERYEYYGPAPAMNIMKAQDLSINRFQYSAFHR